MLLQTNSYVVPRDKREEHERLIRRIRQAMLRLGCDQFEVYEQVGTNWGAMKGGGRFIQIMRFRDKQHHHEIQEAEKNDSGVQQLIAQFMELVDLPEQQTAGSFAMGYYSRVTGGADIEMGGSPVTQEQVPGEDLAARQLDREEHEDDGSGNNKPVKHEESEF